MINKQIDLLSNKKANDNDENKSDCQHCQNENFLSINLRNTKNDIYVEKIDNFCQKNCDLNNVLSQNMFKENSLNNDCEENDSIFYSSKYIYIF